MNVSFTFALNDVDFNMRIGYQADDLQFSSRIHTTAANISHVEDRYKSIDQINRVDINTVHPLRIKYITNNGSPLVVSPHTPYGFFATQEVDEIEFNLEAIILFYSRVIIRWQPDRELPDWITELLSDHFESLKQVLIGTLQYYLPLLKQEAKDTVRANALRRTKIMLGNAEALLEYLGEVF